MGNSKQIAKILAGKLWTFFGGIKTDDRKKTSDCPIEDIGIPALITLPLSRHLGEGGEILVTVGDHVKTGQVLTKPGNNKLVPLHASTSGTILSIAPQILPHPSGFAERCITIKPDGFDEWVERKPILDWESKSVTELLERIRDYSVEGLGGAQFQTAVKLEACLNESTTDCNIFIINGAECEPVITCDDRLMQEQASEIAVGIRIIKKILNPKIIIFAIEDNKQKAIEAIKNAVDEDVLVKVIPTVYPSGAARNLIKIVTGIEIPYSEHTSECGIVVDNVSTVYAVKQAVVDGIPLIKRIITVTGSSLKRQGNAIVRLGTSVRYVLNAFKLNPERKQRIILGGPLMGFTVPSIDVPITKATTCVYAPSTEDIQKQEEEHNCIRCGRCARVCPSRLTPYLMYAYSKASQHDKTLKCGIKDCTECGCCAYVCPSKIRLTNQFRREKAIVKLIADKTWRNERAQERRRIHDERMAQEEALREKKRQAALLRIKNKEALNNSATKETTALEDAEKQKRIAEARERSRMRREAMLKAQEAKEKGLYIATDNKEETVENHVESLENNNLKITAIHKATSAAMNNKDLLNTERKNFKIQSFHNGGRDLIKINRVYRGDDNPPVPSMLRSAAIVKHAPILDHEGYEFSGNLFSDLSKVENPPDHEIIVKKYNRLDYLNKDGTRKAPKLPLALSKHRKV